MVQHKNRREVSLKRSNATMLSKLHRYVTDVTQGAASVPEWQRHLREVFYNHGVKPSADGGVYGHMEKRGFADIGISRHYSNAHTIFRTREMTDLDKVRQHAFVFPTSGALVCRRAGKEIVSTPGTLYIVDASEPFEVETLDNTRSLAILMPSEICRLSLGNIEDRSREVLGGDPLILQSMIGFADGVLNKETSADGLWLRNLCCTLLDATLNPRSEQDGERSWRTSLAARHAILDAARREIKKELHRENFNVSDAASSLRVSTRHLQSVFQDIGSTFTQELSAARLQRAADLLRSSARGTKRVGQIATECGFRSAANFSTRYKEHFGVSPRDEGPV